MVADEPLNIDDDEEVVVDPSASLVVNEVEYVFDVAHVAISVQLADEVAGVGHAAAMELRDLASRRGLGDADAPMVRETWGAVAYELRVAGVGEDAGCTLGGSVPPGVWPPDPRTTSPDVQCLWKEVAQHATQPVIRARFNDLLVVAGASARHLHAKEAAGSYIASVSAADEHDAMEFLIRAWDLARRFGLVEVEKSAIDAMLDRADTCMAEGPSKPGLVLPFLGAAASAFSTKRKDFEDVERRERTIRLLDRALGVYKRDTLAREIVNHIRTAEGSDDPARTNELDRAVVAASMYEADRAKSPAVEMVFLGHAADAARGRGLPDLYDEAIRRMQQIDPDALGLQVIRVESRTPRDSIEHYLRHFTRSSDWRPAMLAFLRTAPPTGDIDEQRETTRKQNAEFVLKNLTSRVSLRSDGLPRFAPTTDADRFEMDVAENAHIAAQLRGQNLALALERMRARYGLPAEADLMVFLAMDGAGDDELAGRLARSFLHHWNHDYEAAVHVAAPLVEASARALLIQLDEAIYRTQVAQSPGGYVGLGVLIDELERLDFDPSWAYYLRWLLVAKTGANVRNDIAHGYAGVDGPIVSALVLRAAALLVWLVPHSDRVKADRIAVQTEIRECLRRPIKDQGRGVAKVARWLSRWLDKAASRVG